MSILIDKEFESLIPPLSAEEFQQLEENCLRDGIRDALIVWEQNGNDILIDGHNRFRIVGKHPTIQFNIKRMQFADRDEAKLWIYRNQIGRRNLKELQLIELGMKMEPLVAAEAKKKQGARNDLKDIPTKSWESQAEKRKADRQNETVYKVAKSIGMSEDTYRKGKAILNSGNQQVIDDVKSGREKIHSGYQRIHPKKTPAQSNKEFVEQAKQEHEAFQSSKTVSIHEAQMDKANRQIIASNVYARLLNMGLRINDIAHDMEEGNIDLKEMCKEIDSARIKVLKQTIRATYEQLMKIDKELKIG